MAKIQNRAFVPVEVFTADILAEQALADRTLKLISLLLMYPLRQPCSLAGESGDAVNRL